MPPIKKSYPKTYQKALTAKQRKQVNALIKKAEKANSANRRFNAQTTATAEAVAGFFFNPLAQIAIGSATNQREGNMIQVDSIDICLQFTGNTTALAANLRWLFVMYYTDEENISPTSGFTKLTTTSLTSAAGAPFIGSPIGGLCTSLFVDPNRATKVLYKRGTLDNKVSTIANEFTWSHRVNMRGRKFKYLSDTTGDFMDGKNLYCAVICDANGAAPAANVGALAVTYLVNFH